MRIGLIQTRGIGDIIIALPIAQHFIDQGDEVHWPVDARFLPFLQAAAPDVHFHPVDVAETGEDTLGYYYLAPFVQLAKLECHRVHCLYASLTGITDVDQRLAQSLKFDEYKYARCGVPFERKWSLRVARNPAREQTLHQSLSVQEPYTLVHTAGSKGFSAPLPDDLAAGNIVHITERTDNPFDWLMTLERAATLILVDSLFANLAEQLNLRNQKILLLRSKVGLTPVFKNGWTYR